MNTIHQQVVPPNFYKYASGTLEFCVQVAKRLPAWKDGKPAIHATRDGTQYSIWIPRSGSSGTGGITQMDME